MSASTTGIRVPKTLNFQSFVKRDGREQELLLHSSNHSMIDYTATEDADPAAKYLKHYVAVYDPASGQLQVTEAKKMTVRSSVRVAQPVQIEDDSPITKIATNYSSRAALTYAFGTKKSKKAVQSVAENRLLSQGADTPNSPISNAIFSSMPAREPTDQPADSPTTAIQGNKPLPVPDLVTNDIVQFYPLSSLVYPAPAAETLGKMPLGEWKDSIENKKPIMSSSRFVAVNSTHVLKAVKANPDNGDVIQTAQMLRYMLVLIELARNVSKLRSEKRLPPPDKWMTWFSGSIPQPLLTKIMDNFCPNGMGPSKFNMILLRTTILALALHIPPPSGNVGPGILATQPYDIQADLNLQAEEVRRLYRELGCKWEPATEAELERWGYLKLKKPKEMGQAPRFAKLKFPVEFPKISRGRPIPR
jgi:DNA-directed RNA polymerase I subunit RPA49